MQSEMLPTLGHCEDSACLVSSSRQLVRLFRCSIHCDRNLCLYHLNAHNVFYEEEKKQNDTVICELQKSLNLYQSIFDQQILSYRELVRQASTILLHNTSSLIPVDQIRPVIEKLQQAISVFQGEKIIIKCEPLMDMSDSENDKGKSENENISSEPKQKVILRIPRVDCVKNDILPPNGEESNPGDKGKKLDATDIANGVESSSVAKKVVEKMKKKALPLKRIQTK